jgi:hypothetical protein
MEKELYMRNCPKCGQKIFYSTSKILIVAIKKNKTCRSCSMVEHYSNPKEREKSSIAHKKSYYNDPSIREKLSLVSIKRFSDQKEREKIGQATRKALENPTIRKKISEAGIKRFSNPEELERIRLLTIEAMNRPEFKEKHSKLIKKSLHKPEIRKKHIESLIKVNYLGRATDIGQVDLINKWNRLGFNFQINYQVHTDNFLAYLDGYDKEKNIVFEYDGKYHYSKKQKQKDLIRQNKIVEILKPKKFWRYDAVNKQFRNILGE